MKKLIEITVHETGDAVAGQCDITLRGYNATEIGFVVGVAIKTAMQLRVSVRENLRLAGGTDRTLAQFDAAVEHGINLDADSESTAAVARLTDRHA